MLTISRSSISQRITERNHLQTLLTSTTLVEPYIRVRTYIGEGGLYDVDFIYYFNGATHTVSTSIPYSTDYTPDFIRNCLPELFI